MVVPVMFNRRLHENEMNKWLDLLDRNTERGCRDRSLAMRYLRLPDTIAFISSVNDEIIGGTAVYRDRNRLGMVLSSVAVVKKHRQSSAFQIIKTSLPFLKSAAIRDVDVIVANNQQEFGIGFPSSLVLDSWTERTLKSIGFSSVGTMQTCVIERDESEEYEQVEAMWDREPNLEGTKQLIWNQNQSPEQMSSVIWNAFDFACNRRTLKTFSTNGATRIAISIDRLQESICIDLLVIDPAYSLAPAADCIASEISRSKIHTVHLPLINTGSIDFVKLVAIRLDASLKSQSVTLLRKQL